MTNGADPPETSRLHVDHPWLFSYFWLHNSFLIKLSWYLEDCATAMRPYQLALLVLVPLRIWHEYSKLCVDHLTLCAGLDSSLESHLSIIFSTAGGPLDPMNRMKIFIC